MDTQTDSDRLQWIWSSDDLQGGAAIGIQTALAFKQDAEIAPISTSFEAFNFPHNDMNTLMKCEKWFFVLSRMKGLCSLHVKRSCEDLKAFQLFASHDLAHTPGKAAIWRFRSLSDRPI